MKILRLARKPTIMKASNNQLHFLQVNMDQIQVSYDNGDLNRIHVTFWSLSLKRRGYPETRVCPCRYPRSHDK